jgi:hypothetical protein
MEKTIASLRHASSVLPQGLLPFFLSYSDLYVPSHGRCSELLLRLITLNNTHIIGMTPLGERSAFTEISSPHMRQTHMLPERLEPPISASERTAADIPRVPRAVYTSDVAVRCCHSTHQQLQ